MKFLRMATSMMMLAGVTLSKKVVRYEGGETELDEKVCLVKYEVFHGDICDPEVKLFEDPKFPEEFMPIISDVQDYGVCHKAPLYDFSDWFFTGALAWYSCKDPKAIKVSNCLEDGTPTGKVDTLENDKCYFNALYKYSWKIKAVETSREEIAAGVVGGLITLIVIVVIIVFLFKNSKNTPVGEGNELAEVE
jgi:hypothetical protein